MALVPPSTSFANQDQWRQWQQLVGLLEGQDEWYSPVTLNDSSGSQLFDARDGGVTIPTLSVTTLGATTVNTVDLNVTGNTTLGNAAGDTLTVTATSTFSNPATFDSTTTVNGTFATTAATNLGNASADAITVMGTTTFRNAANTDTQMYVDPANARVQIGTATALTGATSSRLEVTGRVYLTPASASEDLLTLWRSPSAGSGWTIGVTATPDGLLKFKDDGGQGIIAFGDTASTYQLEVTGDGHFTDDCYVDGDLTAGRAVFGATTWSGAEELRIVGQSRFEGDITATTGTFDFQNSGNSRIKVDSTGVGFFGATPVARPTVTGTLTGATLAQLTTVVTNLINALDETKLGLITDSTT